MIRSSRKSRWTLLGTLVVAAAAALVLPGTGPIRAQQSAPEAAP